MNILKPISVTMVLLLLIVLVDNYFSPIVADKIILFTLSVMAIYLVIYNPFYTKGAIGLDHLESTEIIKDGMMTIEARKDGA